jgi:hypothetical protein
MYPSKQFIFGVCSIMFCFGVSSACHRIAQNENSDPPKELRVRCNAGLLSRDSPELAVALSQLGVGDSLTILLSSDCGVLASSGTSLNISIRIDEGEITSKASNGAIIYGPNGEVRFVLSDGQKLDVRSLNNHPPTIWVAISKTAGAIGMQAMEMRDGQPIPSEIRNTLMPLTLTKNRDGDYVWELTKSPNFRGGSVRAVFTRGL